MLNPTEIFSSENDNNMNENINLIKNFEKLILDTEKATINNKNIFFKEKSLLLDQTNSMKLKCKFMANEQTNKIKKNLSQKQKRSKSTISQIQQDPSDGNDMSFCEKSNRTNLSNFEASKNSDNLNYAKHGLKLSNVSSFLNPQNDQIDNDLSTTLPHSYFDKTSENSRTYKNYKENTNNEFYEKKINLLEEKIKELRMELGKKQSEIKILKTGIINTKVDYNEIFDDSNMKKIGFKKLQNDYKTAKKNYEFKLRNQEIKYQKLNELYKQQQNEMEGISSFIEEIALILAKNEREFEKLQNNNQILLENFKRNDEFKQELCESFENSRKTLEAKLHLYASKLQKFNENELIIEKISAENQELKAQKKFLMQKVRLI